MNFIKRSYFSEKLLSYQQNTSQHTQIWARCYF